eukprot:SAG11_NODE_2007_length_3928_cov_2.013581_3_plen_386_part_00
MAEGWLVKRSGGRAEVPGQEEKAKASASRLSSFGEARRQWEDRYFVLLRGKLSYWKNDSLFQRGAPPSGTLDLRNASIREYEREEEKLKGRVHKFIVVTPDRLFYLCAETREILDMWFEAVGEVIAAAMRTWSSAEVRSWLDINELGQWSMAFYDAGIDGEQLRSMGSAEALSPLVGDEAAAMKLVKLIGLIIASDGVQKREVHAQKMLKRLAIGKDTDSEEYDVFLCYTPDVQEYAEAFVAALPPTPGGLAWKVFMGNGRGAELRSSPRDGVDRAREGANGLKLEMTPEEHQAATKVQALRRGQMGRRTAAGGDDAVFVRHAKALSGCSNYVVLCTGDGFLSRTVMPERENATEIEILRKVTVAMNPPQCNLSRDNHDDLQLCH